MYLITIIISSIAAVNVVVSPDTLLIPTGSNASFQCFTFVSNSNVSLNITWEYPAGVNVVIGGTNLNIINVNSSSEGDYRCIVQSNLQRTMTAVGTLRIGMLYRITGNFGKVFNLEIWQVFQKSPNLNLMHACL